MACADVGIHTDCLNRDSLRGEELTRSDQCQKIPDMIVGKADVAAYRVKVVEMPAAKRRRGRPPRNQGKVDSSSAPPPLRVNPDEEEEDVCFICYDGESLMLCNRRGSLKAYHPACIKRDEAFLNQRRNGTAGGTYVALVRSLLIICAILAHIPHARIVLKMLIM
ncbi:hypothetical protein GQ457_09G009810 [Hibiscus cannabinus]